MALLFNPRFLAKRMQNDSKGNKMTGTGALGKSSKGLASAVFGKKKRRTDGIAFGLRSISPETGVLS